MTAPFDIDPKNESWTQDEMKLRKKGGWSKQFSAALSGDIGFNRWWHNRYQSEYTVGSNPTPSNAGPEVSGGIVRVWQKFTSSTLVLVDDSIDWRDRFLLFIGAVFEDNADPDRYLPSGSLATDVGGTMWYDRQTSAWKFVGLNGQTNSGITVATCYTRNGNDTLSDLKEQLGVTAEDNSGVITSIVMGPKTNGELWGKLILPGSPAGGGVAAGIIIYEPQEGERDT